MIKLFLNETVSGKQGTLDGDGFDSNYSGKDVAKAWEQDFLMAHSVASTLAAVSI